MPVMTDSLAYRSWQRKP